MTAFPQIVSRVDHSNNDVYTILSRLIFNLLQDYPQQGLWLFTSVVKSTKPKREKRGKAIIDMLKVRTASYPVIQVILTSRFFRLTPVSQRLWFPGWRLTA